MDAVRLLFVLRVRCLCLQHKGAGPLSPTAPPGWGKRGVTDGASSKGRPLRITARQKARGDWRDPAGGPFGRADDRWPAIRQCLIILTIF